MFKQSAMVDRLSAGERARQLASKPADLIDLSVGDPDFGSPKDVREAARAAIADGYVHYAPAMGDAELRRAMASYVSETSGGQYKPEEIFITHGGTGAVYGVLSAYLNPDDEILIPDPALSIFMQIAQQNAAKSVMVPTNEDFHLNMDALERAVTPRSRALVLANPSNPTGTVLTRKEMDAVAEFVQRHDLLLLSDETYDHILYDSREHISAARYPEIRNRMILVNTVSKIFAMTGWRIGYIAGPKELIQGPALIHRAAMGPINAVAQRAALYAYTETVRSNWGKWMLGEFERRRNLMVDLVNKTPGLDCLAPEGAIYLFVHVDTPLSPSEFEACCLEHGVGVRSGSEFGPRGEGHVRLCFANNPSTYAEGIARIGRAAAASRSDTHDLTQDSKGRKLS